MQVRKVAEDRLETMREELRQPLDAEKNSPPRTSLSSLLTLLQFQPTCSSSDFQYFYFFCIHNLTLVCLPCTHVCSLIHLIFIS